MLTFEQFMATRRWTEHLELEVEDEVGRGYIYDNCCFIKESNTEWHLTIYNAQWIRPHGELEELEAILYEEYYVPEVAPANEAEATARA